MAALAAAARNFPVWVGFGVLWLVAVVVGFLIVTGLFAVIRSSQITRAQEKIARERLTADRARREHLHRIEELRGRGNGGPDAGR